MKNRMLILYLLICIFQIVSNAQDIKIKKINEYSNIDSLQKKYNKEFQKVNKIDPFKNKQNLKSTSDNFDIINSFNVKKESPNGKYFVAYFEGETSSKYVGFFDKNENLKSYYEINIEPIVNYSSNGNYVVIFSLFTNEFFCFNNNGILLFKSSYDEIIQNNIEAFYNVFIDNNGKYLLINASNKLILLDLNSKQIRWKKELESRRITECEFQNESDLIFIESLLNKEDWTGEDKYTIDLFSISNGDNKGKIQKAAKMYIENKNILVKSQNKWHEYEIK